jgi:hypothetical protein
MNPNATVYYAANLENQRQLDRTASRRWLAETAAVQSGGGCKLDITASLKRAAAATFARPRQLVRRATSMDAQAGA